MAFTKPSENIEQNETWYEVYTNLKSNTYSRDKGKKMHECYRSCRRFQRKYVVNNVDMSTLREA